jgi:polyisoprenoid-binding protein YceI
MDASASKLEFAATFEKTAAPGVFKTFDARVSLDPEKLAESRIDVTIDVTSADMQSADVNKAIRGPEWFDIQRFPKAEFHAADIRRAEGGHYVARGTLTLKGMPQPVEVLFGWVETADTATMEGATVVKRGAFGIGTGEWAATNVIGADVTIKFNVRLRRSR